ncbi:hypothetical protein ABZS66_22585 [Dactylosporangium sp. NPDC005572]|uniref:hypothetical protein n=1 Tax=Dactylosporangium sp. NPDC005572 TaxID=3156889 RepID=UPI0033B5AF28
MSAPTVAMSDDRNVQLINLLRDQSTRRLDVKAGSGRMRAPVVSSSWMTPNPCSAWTVSR